MSKAWFAAALLAFGPAAPAQGAPVPVASDDQLREKARKLNELTGDEAMTDRLRELVKNKESARKLVRTAAKMQRDAGGKDQPFKYNAALVLARTAHAVKEYDAAEAFYEFCADSAAKLQSGKMLLNALDGLIDLNWDQKKYKAVEEVCQRLVESRAGDDIEKAKPFALEKLIQAKAKQGDTDEALRMAEGLIKNSKGLWYFVQLKGWIQREAGDFDAAVATYESVLEKLDEAPGLDDDARAEQTKRYRYILSGIHVDAKNIDKASELLRKLVKENPENATFHNDLGFIMADHDKNLEESEQLVRKALELEATQRQKLLADGKMDADEAKKQNAAYLDSLGWILFKQKKYPEAIQYLEKAIADPDDEEGQHLEIWDHLADAYAAAGDKAKALETWQKALKFEDVSKRDAERRKKVTEKIKAAKGE